MSSQNESGHAKNVANFNDLITFVKKLGADYQPTTPMLKLAGLEELEASARQALKDESATLSSFLNATNRRAEAFEPLKELSTRVVASFSMVAARADVDDLKKYQRKIHGRRAGKGVQQPKPQADGGDKQPPDDKSISVAQLSFDNLAEHFSRMIDAVELNPEYAPNEKDLSVDGLKEKLGELNTANKKVDTAFTDWRSTRNNRSRVLYDDKKGLVAVALMAKEYVKSVYKANSPEYKQVARISFRTKK